MTEDLLAGKYNQSGHKEDDSKEDKQGVTGLSPATAVVEHLGRLQGHHSIPRTAD